MTTPTATRRGAAASRPFMVVLLVATLAGEVTSQNGGLRGPQTAAPGSTIRIDVGGNDPSIEVVDPATGTTVSVPVRTKSAEVTLPSVPPGTILHIRAGRGLHARIWVIEITAP